MPGNPFIGLDSATLSSLRTAYVAAITALASNQSYSLNGRSLTRSNLSEVKETLSQIIAAQADAAGTTTDVTYVSFTGL